MMVAGLMLTTSCEQERDPCLQPKTAPVRLVAKRPVTDTTSIDTLLPRPLWIGIDSAFAIRFPERTSGFQLLLSPLADSCSYALQADSSVNRFDTLKFYYRRKLQFLSNACGFTHFYTLDSVVNTRYQIDSVKITNADVDQNASSRENIQIFF